MIETLEKYAASRSRLQFAYDSGRLVPFLGSGMSFPACRLWKGFVEQMETIASLSASKPAADRPTPAELTRRANRAVQQLRVSHTEDEFADCLRQALHQGSEIPSTTATLAGTFWPLVMTTNYDDLFWTAFYGRWASYLKILGRSVSDCHAVLSSLRSPSEPILWAVQGFLGHMCSCPLPRDRMSELAKEVVVGHQEYRRVTFNSPQFRRAFAEVFRNRSLLFLGFGLQDPYVMDLFGEILELFGPNPMPHYAFAKQDEVDAPFLAQNFNIIAITYESHEALPALIDRLCSDLQAPRTKSTAWSYAMKIGPTLTSTPPADSLEIAASPLPVPASDECVAISVGLKNGQIWLGSLSSVLQSFVKHGFLPDTWNNKPEIIQRDKMVFQLDSYPIFFVAARDEIGERDLRQISAAMIQLLNVSVACHKSVVRVPLLAAGERRATPASFLLTEMIRGYAKWQMQRGASSLKVVIHVVAPDVLANLRSGRIDVPELLLCTDVRFWLELEDRSGMVERIPYHCPPDTKVKDFIALACSLNCQDWTLDITPAPRIAWQPLRANAIDDDETIEEVGVIPGSTVRFSFVDSPTGGPRAIPPFDRISDIRAPLRRVGPD
jgi:hypothetical protein